MKMVIIPVLAISLFGLSGCTNMNAEQQGTGSGAVLGAAAGAGITALFGGNAWTGAAVGAVAGGVAGNIKGRKEDQARYYGY